MDTSLRPASPADPPAQGAKSFRSFSWHRLVPFPCPKSVSHAHLKFERRSAEVGLNHGKDTRFQMSIRVAIAQKGRQISEYDATRNSRLAGGGGSSPCGSD